jgi:hypothetical protein
METPTTDKILDLIFDRAEYKRPSSIILHAEDYYNLKCELDAYQALEMIEHKTFMGLSYQIDNQLIPGNIIVE